MNAEQKELTEEEYEEMLNDIYGDVNICGGTYTSGHALKMLDPTAFRVGLSDWETELWFCSECDKEYNDEEEAEECCK